MKLDLLVLNSYAGSILIGGKDAGMKIRGSYEDVAYGIEAQKLNFPKENYVDKLPWPEDDLRQTVVAAHPPCAAFSLQNNSPSRRGLDTDAFRCHRQVMDYALGSRCAALTIESVPGVLQAAAAYAEYAKKYHYTHYFVYLNSATFGLPQWRPRVWVVFLRDRAKLVLNHTPVYRTISDIVQHPGEVGEPHPAIQKLLVYFGKKFDAAGFDFAAFLRYDNLGPFVGAVAEFAGCDKTREAVDEICGTSGLFGVRLPRKLDPDWFSNVILDGALSFVHGRPLTLIEYQRIMGFPDTWRWPVSMEKKFSVYLSKGVCPPVARWVVEQMVANAAGTVRLGDHSHVGAPGEIIDIRCNREQAIEGIRRARQLPLPVRA